MATITERVIERMTVGDDFVRSDQGYGGPRPVEDCGGSYRDSVRFTVAVFGTTVAFLGTTVASPQRRVGLLRAKSEVPQFGGTSCLPIISARMSYTHVPGVIVGLFQRMDCLLISVQSTSPKNEFCCRVALLLLLHLHPSTGPICRSVLFRPPTKGRMHPSIATVSVHFDLPLNDLLCSAGL